MSYTTIENPDAPALVVLEEAREVIVVSGALGPKGDTGGTSIGGALISVTSLQNGDLLQYDSSTNTWKNVPQSSITDGGTF